MKKNKCKTVRYKPSVMGKIIVGEASAFSKRRKGLWIESDAIESENQRNADKGPKRKQAHCYKLNKMLD